MKHNINSFEITELEERLEMAPVDAGGPGGVVEPLKCDNRCNDSPPAPQQPTEQ